MNEIMTKERKEKLLAWYEHAEDLFPDYWEVDMKTRRKYTKQISKDMGYDVTDKGWMYIIRSELDREREI